MVHSREGGVACHRKCLVSGVYGVLQRVFGVCQGSFVDREAINGDNSLQRVLFSDPGIKASIQWTLGVNNI